MMMSEKSKSRPDLGVYRTCMMLSSREGFVTAQAKCLCDHA